MRGTEILSYINREMPIDYTSTHINMSSLKKNSIVKKQRRELQKAQKLQGKNNMNNSSKPYFETKLGKLYHGDCLDIMNIISDKSIDMIFCDLPYGTTACSWDVILPFDKLWEQYERIIKDNGAIVLTASQPFTSLVVCSNLKLFKYEWIWEKSVGSNFATLKYQPMKEHESILVFCKKSPQYFPILQTRKGSGAKRLKYGHSGSKTGEAGGGQTFDGGKPGQYDPNLRAPSSIQYFNNRESCRGLHPTQKPISMLEYLIKTYTNEEALVLDNCAGSGTTGAACENLDRGYILIEKEDKYCKVISKRLDEIRREKLIYG